MDKKSLIKNITAVLKNNKASEWIKGALEFDTSSQTLKACDEAINVIHKKIYLTGFGKCCEEMARGTLAVLDERVEAGFLLSYKDIDINDKIKIYESSHPIPNEKAFANSLKLVKFAQQLEYNDILICLVSGGGSSFFESPEDGISQEELSRLYLSMVKSKMPIGEINTVRKIISKVKGGKFLKMIKAKTITLAISDVIGGLPSDIASGPTWPCEARKNEAQEILHRYNIEIPPSVSAFLKTPNEAKLCHIKPEHIFKIIGDNFRFVESFSKNLAGAGLKVINLGPPLVFNAENSAKEFFEALVAEKLRSNEKFALVAGGETPVDAGNKNGSGGRCQHFALALKKLLKANSPVFEKISFAAFATDGVEAFTDAAGAVFDDGDIRNSSIENIEKHLIESDSYNYFKSTGGLIKTGPTGHNVNDVFAAVIS